VSIKMFGFEQEFYQSVSVLALIFLIVCTASAKVVNDSVTSSINMRFDNQDLLATLQIEKDRVEEALKREAHANQAKSKFLAVASHDLRQPLHSLRLFTATLALQTQDTRHKTLVSQIDTSVKSLEELFNALLDISKLDAGTLTADKNHVELHGLLMQLQSEFQPLAAEKGLEFVCELEECVVYTDIVLLERVIRNLINNAIRYTAIGTVTVYTERQNDCLSINVMDTGPGISSENQLRVFDEFVQLNEEPLASDQGIGLGLSIVKRLSILLDIPILVTSQPDSGSIFTVKIPYGLPEKCLAVHEDVINYANENVESCFVLIIDDETTVCQAVEGLLETWGCVVMTAISGEAAVRQLEEIGEIPDVIISDYQLRNNETGGSAIHRVRNYLNKEIPAIVLTGDIAPERLLAIKHMGFPMLHKPCEPDALRMLLAQQTNGDFSEAVQS
jgi:signal transduction histidine kinase/CheY-like chemotaxis protein